MSQVPPNLLPLCKRLVVLTCHVLTATFLLGLAVIVTQHGLH